MRHVMWGVCGTVVLVYIFLAVLGAFEPGEVVEVTVAAVALAVAFLVHEWRGQFRAEHLRH
jgi:tetrahydromethanopterin S-methyltransferase subunit C